MPYEPTVTRNQDVITGMWKFEQSVSLDQLKALALEWKMAEPEKFLHLYIRQCSRDQNAIGFQYRTNESEKRFHYRMADKLYKLFGMQFVGWDCSADTWIIQ